MNKASAAKRHRWLALACVVVTTVASAPIFMAGLHETLEERGLPEGFLPADSSSVEPRADELLAFAGSPFAELLSLLSEASESVPLDLLSNAKLIDIAPASLGYLGNDRSAHGAMESFAGGAVAGDDAALAITPPVIYGEAMPTNGGYVGAAPTTAAAPSGVPSAIGRAALPRMLTQPTGTPGVVVAELGRKRTTDLRDDPSWRAGEGVQNSSPYLTAADANSGQGSGSNAGSGTQGEPSANLVDNILLASAPLSPMGPLTLDVEQSQDPNQMPGSSGPLFRDVEPPLSDADPLPILAAASDSDSLVPSGAPPIPPSFAPLQVEGPNQEIPEPATLALLGLSLAGIGFSRRRR